jgi:NitT/TauT family transport system permease protein
MYRMTPFTSSPKCKKQGYTVFERKQKGGLPKWAEAALCALFWLFVWQILSVAVGKEVLLPAPLTTLRRVASLASSGEFWATCAMSLLRIGAGFLLAALLGGVIALLTAFVPFLRALCSPALSVIKATPVASFIVLALVWMKSGSIPTFTAFLMVLPIVWLNTHAGLLSADEELLEMARAFRLSRRTVFAKIYLPSALPYFTAACGTGAGLAWKAGIAAEVLGRTALSMGKEIYDAKIYLETVDLFAWTAVLILFSVLFEKLILVWLRRMNRRFTGGMQDAV